MFFKKIRRQMTCLSKGRSIGRRFNATPGGGGATREGLIRERYKTNANKVVSVRGTASSGWTGVAAGPLAFFLTRYRRQGLRALTSGVAWGTGALNLFLFCCNDVARSMSAGCASNGCHPTLRNHGKNIKEIPRECALLGKPEVTPPIYTFASTHRLKP